MLIQKSFSCCLIGEDTLLIHCAEILLAENHVILGIISPLIQIKDWALAHNIPYFESLTFAEEDLSHAKYDYLFSIINSHILPSSFFERCQKFAINFHDSPLPRLAGVYATSWAILNNESQHGITWHIINAMIDGGDILKQITFPITSNETALSLKLKCYHYAIIAFTNLVDELTQQTYQPFPQDLSQRTYYGLNKKPPSNGWISWNNSAENIDRLCRGLHRGKHTCPFGLVKFIIGQDVFVVDEWKLGKQSKKQAGTLVKCSYQAWEIATTTKNIILLKISTLEGQSCDFERVAQQHQLNKNDRLVSPSTFMLKKFEKISNIFSKYEPFWVKELSCFNAASFPFLMNINLINHDLNRYQKDLNLPEFISETLAKLYPDEPISLILLTVWFVYLYRLDYQENLAVSLYKLHIPKIIPPKCSPFFSQQLPFSISFEPNMTFREALKCVKEKYQALKKYITYEKSILRSYSKPSNQSTFSSLAICITDESANKLKNHNFDALLTFIISKDGKRLFWLIPQEILKNETNLLTIIDAFPEHFSMLCQSLLQNNSKNIIHLNMLSEAEKQKIFFEWNPSEGICPKHQTIASLFEKQADITPHCLALSDEIKNFSYNDLNKLANQLARYLQNKGVKEGMMVALCSGHDILTIISMLAIVKLGAIYVPLDPNAPSEQIKSVLQDNRPKLIITRKYSHSKIKNTISTNLHNQCLDIDRYQNLILKEDDTNLNKKTSTRNLVCILYTSGTTGKPKGVMITHNGIIRLVKNTNYIVISANDVIAQAASLSFDAALFEIWGALLNGASLICISKNTLLHPYEFTKFLNGHSISILWLTSALFDQYALADPTMFKDLNYLLVGGDVLNRETIGAVLKCPLGSPQYLLNGYGPTENTTFTTTHLISNESIKKTRIPIGKPINNTTVYVLDRYLNPMPVGIPGEIYIGGSGLSLGYIHQLKLTQSKFILNPFAKNPKEKLYKTGDIACWLPNGDLDYLGRQDKQVKIRGFRIELEAVQNHVLKHGAVSQCYVCVYEDRQRGKILVAYVVLYPETQLDLVKLKNMLYLKLPNYMVPNDFIVLGALPLTQNGKVDGKALPLPQNHKNIQTSYIPPTNNTEKKLEKLWCELFNLNQIGIEDNFFSLGGHSLLLTKLLLDLKKFFDFELSPHHFLKSPTIASLAKLIENKTNDRQKANFLENFQKDIQLDFFIESRKYHYVPKPVQSLLLTGVTGFLGSYLLKDLYQYSEAKIYCLIRANSPIEAEKILLNIMAKFNLNKNDLNKRLIPIIGDLIQPLLGLTQEKFLQLGRDIDAIYHSAAYVHHLYSYEMLRFANVLGTIELLKLAITANIKPFYYISTLSAVSEEKDIKGLIKEDFVSSSIPVSIQDGYSQTKWVSECLLSQAYKKGIPVKIYRPAWILGDSINGTIIPNNNHLMLFIKGCIQLGVSPDWKANLNILPVNVISYFIIKSSMDSEIEENVFNLSNPNTISWIEMIKYINLIGYTVNIIPTKVWKETYLKSVDKNNALYNLLTIYVNSNTDWMKDLDRICHVHHSNTKKILKKLYLEYPIINKRLLDIYFCYLIRKKFLPSVPFKTSDKRTFSLTDVEII